MRSARKARDILIDSSVIQYYLSSFWKRVEKKENGCWIWKGSIKNKFGHGRMFVNRKAVSSHRFAYKFIGSNELDENLVVDHICNQPSCVNPKHLQQITNKANVLKGNGITAKKARQEYCLLGHPLFGENLGISVYGFRQCKECRRRRLRESRSRWKAIKAKIEEIKNDKKET